MLLKFTLSPAAPGCGLHPRCNAAPKAHSKALREASPSPIDSKTLIWALDSLKFN